MYYFRTCTTAMKWQPEGKRNCANQNQHGGEALDEAVSAWVELISKAMAVSKDRGRYKQCIIARMFHLF